MVRCGDLRVALSPGKQRAVLAALLLRANQVVSVDELAETLWGLSPPPSARVTVQNNVMRLRRALGEACRDRISTQRRGYMIRVAAGELDMTRFEHLLGSARAAARDGSWAMSAQQARGALELWRGEPLADVDSEVLAAREVPRLAELRLQTLELRNDADLHLGRHAEAIAELRRLASEHPLRERLHGLLMLALYRDGRQAEALAAYAAARRVLIEELGTEPGTGLRKLHQRILTADPALELAENERPAAAAPEPVVPRQLPATVRHFTGRARELAELSGLLDGSGGETVPMVVISAIAGTAGVGKTALAVQWAHQVADRFPDGQLYVNLRGYDPGQPVLAADALAGFLRALDVSGPDIPAEEHERATRYRSLLAGRRMLVVLDNAGSADQVRPLLPGTPACVVVVTSRDSLAGLVARDGAARVDLDLLPLAEAVDLLRALIGRQLDADPAAAATLASQCSRLPLALRVAAELAAARPAVPLADLVGELADQQRRLDLLDAGGDRHTAVRAVFSWSYRHLGTGAARMFQLAALHPGPDLDPYAAAALSGTTVERAVRLLDQLTRAHLIQSAGPGRYCMHDLLRAYALDLVAAVDTEDEQRAPLTCVFDYYLYTAATAMDVLYPAERGRRPRIPAPASPVPPVTDPATAQVWLDAEQANLVAAAANAAAHGWPDHAFQLAATVSRYLNQCGHYSAAIAINSHARFAAVRAANRAAEAEALTNLGTIEWHQGRFQHATTHYRQALTAFRECGDRDGQARVWHNLGGVDMLQGRFRQAADQVEQAMVLFREAGDQVGEGRSLQNLGFVELRQGRYPEAAGHLQCALDLFCQTGDPAGQAHALANLGTVDLEQGRFQQAAGRLQAALDLFCQSSNRAGQAHVLGYLGLLDLRQGRCHRAVSRLDQSLALFRETGELPGEAEALNGLGEASVAVGRVSRARAHHRAALDLATAIGDKYQQARAHNGLARSHHAAGDLGQARRHWQRALTLYTALGVPEADQVRAQLADAGEPLPLSSMPAAPTATSGFDGALEKHQQRAARRHRPAPHEPERSPYAAP
jgi:DNA-binding SARP family transcriptional activator/Tfp pilus assembly protein PilF